MWKTTFYRVIITDPAEWNNCSRSVFIDDPYEVHGVESQPFQGVNRNVQQPNVAEEGIKAVDQQQNQAHSEKKISESDMDTFLRQYAEVKTLYQNHDVASVSVVKCKDTSENVVLKVTNLSRVSTEHRLSVQREIQIHQQLDHPNIARLIDWRQSDSRMALVLEHVQDDDGYFNQRLVINNEPYNMELDGGLDELSTFLFELLDALQYLHETGVVHLDLKPENILVQKDGTTAFETKLIDFGLARQLENGEAFVDLQCGSFDYKAPEVKDQSMVTSAADMFSFGMFVYMLVVGYFPKALNWSFGKPVPFNRRCWRKYKDGKIQEVIKRCLEHNPADRISAKGAIDLLSN